MTIKPVLTRSLTPTSGCALDPCVEEVSWIAWRLESASPNMIISDSSIEDANGLFDRILEMAWLPGRVVAISEVGIELSDGFPQLEVHLCLAVMGPSDTTAEEASSLADLVHRRIHASGRPYRASMVDAASVLDLADDTFLHTALIRQRTISLDVESSRGDIEVLSRWNPIYSPWVNITTALLTRTVPTRVRATVLPTELNVTDRLHLDEMLRRGESARDALANSPGHRFPVERAVATLVDLQQSFSTPVLCAEVAVLSAEPLPEVFLREIGSSLTSERDVVRRGGHTVVAGQQLMLGGFDIERNPRHLAAAVRAGLPVRGGLDERGLSELITLSESPVGWPIPINGPIPTIPTGTVRSLAVSRGLSEGVPIGTGPGGLRVHLPQRALGRHAFFTGTTGAGKTTAMVTCSLDDLRNERAFLYLDPHGDAAERVVAFADLLDVLVISIDPNDPDTDRLQLLPRLKHDRSNYVECEAAARRICDAIVASLPDKRWAGPRWYQIALPIVMLAMAHGGTIGDAVRWVQNDAELRSRLRHPALTGSDTSALASLTSSRSSDATEVRDWVISKFGPLMGVSVERVVARAGAGVSIAEVLELGAPVIVNLSALAHSEASLVGHLILSAVLESAMERPAGTGNALRAYVDEAQRFVVHSMQRVQTEGRKFGVSLALATQSLRALDPVLSDIASSAAVQVAFRQTPDSAGTLSPLIGVPARELTDLPDLHAYIKVAGESTCSVLADPYPPTPPRRHRTPRAVAESPAAPDRDESHSPTEPLEESSAFPDDVLDGMR